MRELTKSINSFSWAMTLFGLEQASRLLAPWPNPSQGGAEAAHRSFDAVGQVAGDSLSGIWRRSFDTLDGVQRRAVDVAFDLVSLDPARLTRGASDALQRSVQATRQFVSSWI